MVLFYIFILIVMAIVTVAGFGTAAYALMRGRYFETAAFAVVGYVGLTAIDVAVDLIVMIIGNGSV